MLTTLNMNSSIYSIISAYESVKKILLQAGYGDEIEWQRTRKIDFICEESFLKEIAWVILSSGMRERVIRRVFPNISTAFFDWHSSEAIARNPERCRGGALARFNHSGKIDAIISVAQHVAQNGFDSFWDNLSKDLLQNLQNLPYLGPATSLHLLKNLGIPTSKPDRHLTRLAFLCGSPSPQELCTEIARFTQDDVHVVDVVLWRYATLDTSLRFFGLSLEKGRLTYV
jgi:hypothetical protein